MMARLKKDLHLKLGLSSEAPKLPFHIQQRHDWLDALARVRYKMVYAKLSDSQKTVLHVSVNLLNLDADEYAELIWDKDGRAGAPFFIPQELRFETWKLLRAEKRKAKQLRKAEESKRLAASAKK